MAMMVMRVVVVVVVVVVVKQLQGAIPPLLLKRPLSSPRQLPHLLHLPKRLLPPPLLLGLRLQRLLCLPGAVLCVRLEPPLLLPPLPQLELL